jgi:hypothetical protein
LGNLVPQICAPLPNTMQRHNSKCQYLSALYCANLKPYIHVVCFVQKSSDTKYFNIGDVHL